MKKLSCIFFISCFLGFKLFGKTSDNGDNGNLSKGVGGEGTSAYADYSDGQLGNHRHAFGLGVGQTFLAGGFHNKGDHSITFDGLYTYKASYSFDVLVSLHYSQHEKKETRVRLKGAGVGIKGRFYQFDSFAPYAVAGLGFYRPSWAIRGEDGSLQNSKEKTSFGLHAGVGADLFLNEKFTLGMLFHYHNPFDVKQDDAPEVSGHYGKLLLTLMYNL